MTDGGDPTGSTGPGGPTERATGPARGGAGRAREGDGGDEALPPLPVRAVQVFVAPGELFGRLRRNPAWAGVLAVVVVLAVASVFFTPTELMEQLFLEQMGPEATEEDVEQVMGVARPLSYASAVLGPLLTTAALGGFLYFSYTLVLGGEGRFGQLFSVSAHAMLIPTVGSLALLPLMIATGDPEVRLALHLLVPGLDADTYLHAFLRGLNVFALWTAAVLGVGVAAVYRRSSAAAPALFLISAYVVTKAVVALFVA